ncbi:MAG: hypothetical protein QF681_00680 [Vicinamibacterales bacterium]|nr:hypothetical protein [Vicinamibacterales bacterium]
MSFVPRVQGNSVLVQSVWAAAGGLLVWQAVLFVRLRHSSAHRSFHTILRSQHYLQATLHTAVFAYWGYFWRPVYDHVWLLVAQLLFAYAFDMLLSWSRRDSYGLGFGPFPIIFSTNLFLWFRDDWFYLQFLMLAAGFMGKELVRWQRDGKRTHVFNPSAFSLGLFSLVLIATGTTDLTWGQDIASTLTLAPNIYLFLFVIGLVAMYFFSITLVAGSAAIVLFGSSALYGAVTGVPYFIDSEIPSAVFLGLHLLVTDPSTSPRTSLGKAIFGMLYGLGVFVLYAALGAIGVPTFYDKLLCVPLLNLSVQRIDRLVRSLQDNDVIARWRPDWTTARANLVHITVWVLFFSTMTAAGATDGRHRGDSVPFWEQACAEERPRACERLIQLETNYCGDNAGWACNELGRHYAAGTIVVADRDAALGFFSQACELRFQAGCVNLLDEGAPSRADPRALDFRLLLREAGPNLLEMPEPELHARACDHGWTFACDGSTE